MTLYIFSIKDIVANSFSELKLFPNKEVAIRWFEETTASIKHSSDLQLFILGSYNLDTGAITPVFDYITGGKVNNEA